MSKADNNNDYDYDQTLSEKHAKATYYPWTRGLSMKAGPEVSLQSLGQRFEHEVWIESQI